MDHNKATIHDGNRVRRALEHKQMPQTEFAGGMGWNTSRTSRMLQQPSWKTEELMRAGEILGCNLFEDYQPPATGHSRKVTVLMPLELDLDREAYDTAQRQLREVWHSLQDGPSTEKTEP